MTLRERLLKVNQDLQLNTRIMKDYFTSDPRDSTEKQLAHRQYELLYDRWLMWQEKGWLNKFRAILAGNPRIFDHKNWKKIK